MTMNGRQRIHDKDHLEGLRAGLYCRVSVARDKDGQDHGEVITDKSTEDQAADGRRFAHRRGLTIAGVYSDPDISASRFAIKKERPQFNQMLADIRAGKLDLVWFWELSRSQRRLGVFADLRDLCRDHGVLWAVGDTVYDPTRYEDMMLLGVLSIVAEGESEIKSKNVTRGHASNAAAGLPHGPVMYGYRRFYTAGPRGRRLAQALDRVEPDALAAGAVLAPGGLPAHSQLVKDSPAWIVQEMFDRFAAGWGLARIAADLNRRGVPTSRQPGHGTASANPQWNGTTVRGMLKNARYVGQRVYQGQVIDGVQALWAPLVDAGTFWSVQRQFSDPSRRTTRVSNKPTHLLSGIARCGECGHAMYQRVFARDRRRAKAAAPVYVCQQNGCNGIAVKQDVLDEYVEDKIILWGSDPAVYAALTEIEDSAAAAAAQADIARFEAELEETRQLFDDGAMSPVMAARKEQKLLAQLEDAERRGREAVMPKVLADNVGPQFAHRWVNVLEITAKKQILRAVAGITVNRVGSGRYHQPVSERVTWRWLTGPSAGTTDG
jgi:DNA invertase Pin-like site-specific DNA recombinase